MVRLDGLDFAWSLEMETSADALATVGGLGAGAGAEAVALPANILAMPARTVVAAEAADVAASLALLSPPIITGSWVPNQDSFCFPCSINL